MQLVTLVRQVLQEPLALQDRLELKETLDRLDLREPLVQRVLRELQEPLAILAQLAQPV